MAYSISLFVLDLYMEMTFQPCRMDSSFIYIPWRICKCLY